MLNASELHTLKLLILQVFYRYGVGQTTTAIQMQDATSCSVTPAWTWGSCLPPPDQRVATGSALEFSTMTIDHKHPLAPTVSTEQRCLSPEPGASMINWRKVTPVCGHGEDTAPAPRSPLPGTPSHSILGWGLLLPPPRPPRFESPPHPTNKGSLRKYFC